MVVAPDWRAFGERRLGGDFGQRDACNVFFIKGMLMGVNLLALNVWDALRSIEYLQLTARGGPRADRLRGSSRTAGTMTLYTAALDERVKCAVVSGYLNSFEAYGGAWESPFGNTCGRQQTSLTVLCCWSTARCRTSGA